MGPEFLAILIIVAVLAGGTRSGRNFLREAHKATGWRTPRAAVQHHSGRLGAMTGRGVASGARVSGRGARLAARHASAGIWNRNGRPLIPLMWRPAPDDPAGNTDSTRSPVADPPKDYGPGPWAVTGRSRSGRKISALKDRDTETIAVWDPDDLKRRLDAAAGDPDIEVRVTPLPPSDGPSSAGTAPAPAPRVCVACGNPEGGKWGPLVSYDKPLYAGETATPRLIHKAHFEDESTGFYGEPYKPAPDPGGNPSAGPQNAPPGAGNRRVNMTNRYMINLEPPVTDGEFLESCTRLGDVLKSLAEQISDWADSLSALSLPQSVLNPLHQISDGITDAAQGASQAATNFEAEFEDARDVAARGMHFTGQDAA